MKTVLITGIDKGIGAALCHKFLNEGWRVFGTVYRHKPSHHDNLTIFHLDLSTSLSIKDCTQSVSKAGQKIDVLINNAAVLLDNEETRVVSEKLRQTLDINVIGTIDFTEHLVPLMNAGGHIINISSTAGSLDKAGRADSHKPYHYPAYKISKAALNMYTRTLALQLKDITVSSVHPGWVKTDMGGTEADITAEEAADGIYTIATSPRPTGEFWFQDENIPW
ncbi:MAG: oxidoreductase [Candidatus Parcubacteria bacterium]|jgi:NAD(P)-dependent dehydrogenase (short-subunit alcohol dehydrogenase family)